MPATPRSAVFTGMGNSFFFFLPLLSLPASSNSFQFLYFTFQNVQLTSVLGGCMPVCMPSKRGYKLFFFFIFYFFKESGLAKRQF